MDKRMLLLQMNDSSFPIGAFTHSFGLESYVQLGEVVDMKSAYAYIKANLASQVLYNDLLAIKLIFDSQKNMGLILEIENLLNVSTSPRELREGVQKLGRRFLKTLHYMGFMKASENLDFPRDYKFLDRYFSMSLHPTQATTYGVFTLSCEIDYRDALLHFLYAQASFMVTNCVKSVPLSQNQGQVILRDLHKDLREILNCLEGLGWEHFCSSAPCNDIKAMQHEFLYSRLYMS